MKKKERTIIQSFIAIIIWTIVIVFITIGFMRCTIFPEPIDYLVMAKEISKEIIYKADNIDEWQLPYETELLGTGDCEDMTILLIWRVFTKYNIRGSLVCVSLYNGYHAVARFDDDLLYDSTIGIIFDLERFNSEIQYELGFQVLFFMAAIKEYEE